jgi:mannose-1-phosphate guanylyltransferase/mannose-6-phosphate isomerase
LADEAIACEREGSGSFDSSGWLAIITIEQNFSMRETQSMKTLLQPVILSGGVGTRLWPYSREAYPKQFVSFTGEKTLLQDTAARIMDIGLQNDSFELVSPLVVCNELHRFLVAEQLRQLELGKSTIILEPVGRNTAPALTLAALQATAGGDNPVLIVMPSDHYIQDLAHFQRRVLDAAQLAADGYLVTFGIVADRPETGFGYIRKGRKVHEMAFELEAFIEKPSAEKAARYIAAGDCLWNSGLFVMQASVWLEQIGLHCPDIASTCTQALEKSRRDGDFIRVDQQLFTKSPSDSIDYAVMERITRQENRGQALVLPLDAGWSDLGSWPALREIRGQDADGNVIHGDVFTKDAKNSVLFAQNRFLAALGIHDLVVIETPDAVLVAHKECAQDVRSITEHLKKSARSEHVFHTKVHRPWGDYESIDNGNRYQVKRLTVNPGATLSLQMHHHRAEHWIVVKGTARVTRGEESFLLAENESTFIPLGVKHRLENPGSIPLEIIEVQSGSYLGEDDIVRFEDKYNRIEA